MTQMLSYWMLEIVRLRILGSPNLKVFGKSAVQVEFSGGDDDGFVKKVKESFEDFENTTVCILGNFDGESLKVAELLFSNAFKKAYAIRDGVRGSNGWLENCSGSLSSSEFQIAANVFAEKWEKFNSVFPEWLWIDCSNRLGFAAHQVNNGYLTIQNVLFQRTIKEEHDEGNSTDNEEPFDNATLVNSTDDDDIHRYEFHVVYSPSYMVPVLYFRVHSSDGQPLNIEEIEKNLPNKSAKVMIESKWTFIT